MAMDGVAVCALTKELNEKLTGLRIDKIYQPEHDEIHITLHGFGQSYRLLLTANANVARVCFTNEAKPNPTQPPMFCMLLRKHLSGGKILKVHQPDFERAAEFHIAAYNEFGDEVVKRLIVEMMGRHSNIILADENGKIADSIKRVDFSVSSVRQILPGLPYEAPPPQGKRNPLTSSAAEVLEVLQTAGEGEKADKLLLSSFAGISPLIAREIVFRALGTTEATIGELDFGVLLDIATQASLLFESIAEGWFSPCMLTDVQTGKPLEFSPIPILQYGELAELTQGESFAELVELFYRERDRKEHMAHRSAHLVKLVNNHMERCAKKLQLQQAELSDTEKKERWRQYGELLTANLYRVKQGMENIAVENYFEENAPLITIPLDTRLSPSTNAQKYYKKYAKAKSAQQELTRQIMLCEEELSYLETVEEALAMADGEAELGEIADELAEQGYLRRAKQDKKKKQTTGKPLRFVSSDGFTILVGRNNKQNDVLTLKTGRATDLWFHTKNIPGSHTLLVHDREREFSDSAVSEAAALAAFYSKAKGSSNVPVDYTLVKNVKKPTGAKPGFVIYTTNQTVYVTPPTELSEFAAREEN